MLRGTDSGDGRFYLSTLPAREEVAAGQVLVHNHVRPTLRIGSRGFRAWLEAPGERLAACDCGWAAELGIHYRVALVTPPVTASPGGGS